MARRRPRHMSERLLSNVFAEPNFYRVKDYISAHLKEQYTLKEIRGPIRLNSRLFLQANDTAQKTMQLSRITNEVVGDMCIMSIWINDEVLHFELSYLLITDNADFVALHRICEFMVLCFYTNRDSPPEWLHSRWIFSPYERIGFTVLGDSQCLSFYVSNSLKPTIEIMILSYFQIMEGTERNWLRGCITTICDGVHCILHDSLI